MRVGPLRKDRGFGALSEASRPGSRFVTGPRAVLEVRSPRLLWSAESCRAGGTRRLLVLKRQSAPLPPPCLCDFQRLL